jgi:hypothetical protein
MLSTGFVKEETLQNGPTWTLVEHRDKSKCSNIVHVVRAKNFKQDRETFTSYNCIARGEMLEQSSHRKRQIADNLPLVRLFVEQAPHSRNNLLLLRGDVPLGTAEELVNSSLEWVDGGDNTSVESESNLLVFNILLVKINIRGA